MLRKNTESLRLTLSQEFRYVLQSETDAPANTTRRITLSFPQSPAIALVILPYAVSIGNQIQVAQTLADFAANPAVQQSLNSPVAFGLNRYYKAPIWNLTAPVRFGLRPEQSIIAASTDGVAELAMIVEYRAHK